MIGLSFGLQLGHCGRARLKRTRTIAQALAMLGRYAAVADEAVPAAGLTLQRALITTAAPALDARGWDATVAALMGVAREDPLSRLAAGVRLTSSEPWHWCPQLAIRVRRHFISLLLPARTGCGAVVASAVDLPIVAGTRMVQRS